MISARVFLAAILVTAPLSSGCSRSATGIAQSEVESENSVFDTVTVKERIVDSTFDDIKFEMEKTAAFKQSMLTPKIEELLEHRIRIRGFMFPTLKKRGLKQFVLVRDNLECCFGPGAALFDCILVHMKEGQTAEYSIRPVAVEGTFRLEEVIGPDGNHLAIYRLDGEEVK